MCIILAAEEGHTETVQLILAVPDINVNMQDIAGQCALIVAAEEGHKETVQLLLAVPEIDVNVQSNSGWCIDIRSTARSQGDCADPTSSARNRWSRSKPSIRICRHE